jgi:VanZ family protein
MWPLARYSAAWLLVAMYAGGLMILSSTSQSSLVPAWDLPHLDKLFHAFAHAGLTLVLIRALSLTFTTSSSAKLMVCGVMLAICYGACNEIIQAFTPDRTMSVSDGLANAVGVGIVAWIWPMLRRRWPMIAP